MPDLSGIETLVGKKVDIDDKLEFLYRVLPQYQEEGFNGARTLSDLRSYGFRIGSDLFYYARRQAMGEQNEFESIRYFPSSYSPSDIDLGVTDQPLKDNYRIIYRVQHENQTSGELHYTYFGVDYNSLGTIRDLEDMGQDYYSSFYPGVEDEGVKLEVWKGMRKLQ